jgi:hypothetical protein
MPWQRWDAEKFMKLEAFQYYYIPSKDIGLPGIVAKPTPELLKLPADLIAAVTPFTVETGTSAAFVTTPDNPVIDPSLIQYVSAFVPRLPAVRSLSWGGGLARVH